MNKKGSKHINVVKHTIPSCRRYLPPGSFPICLLVFLRAAREGCPFQGALDQQRPFSASSALLRA